MAERARKMAMPLLVSVWITVTMLSFMVIIGKQQMRDSSFDYAMMHLPDGSVQKIEIASWKNYKDDWVRIVSKDGTVYLVSAENVVLGKEAQNETNNG